MPTKNNAVPAVFNPENIVDLYVRVSTVEQSEEGYSVGEQEARLRSYCSAMGFTINAVHTDPGYSGATLDRPGINQVIKDVRGGYVKKVIVWKLDRLSRSQKDVLILLEDVFLENGCNFISLMESFDTATPFGRCIVGILAAFAQMERENIKSRMMMGKHAGLKEGRYFSGRAPIGYQYQMQPNGRLALTVDPYTSKAVQDMFRLYASGKSESAAAGYVQEKYGLFPNLDRHSAAGRVSRIMRNPVYMGKVRMKDQCYEGRHEPLVDPGLWQAVNERLSQNLQAFKRSYGGSDGLLCGLLFCGDCGARMAIRSWKRKGGEKVKKYMCYSISRATPAMIRSENCSNRKKHLTLGELDSLVLDEIKKLALDPAAIDPLIEESAGEAAPDLPVFQERMASVEKQITRLLNLYQNGVVELEEIQGRLSALKEERGAVQKRLDEAEKASAGKLPKEAALASLASLGAIIESGDKAALYDLVHTLIEKVVYLNGDITIYWAFC
ncbi:recombinase family protein [Lachnospiraceae bacterium 29-84]